MSVARAIKAGNQVPADSRVMKDLRCGICGASYVITHPEGDADHTLAERQATFLRGYLEGEHVSNAHQQHREVYEPLAWSEG